MRAVPNVARRDPRVAASETATTGDLGHDVRRSVRRTATSRMPCRRGGARHDARRRLAVRRSGAGAGGYGRRVRRMRRGSGAGSCSRLYLLVELLVAAGASAAYSLRDDTISALGMLTCAPGHAGSVVDVCSPGHVAAERGVRRLRPAACGGRRAPAARARRGGMGGSRRLALGRLGALRRRRRARAGRPAAGVARRRGAARLRPPAARGPRHGRGAAEVGRRAAAASPCRASSSAPRPSPRPPRSVLRLGGPTWVGGLERLALWPAYPWLAVVAWALLVARRSETVAKV